MCATMMRLAAIMLTCDGALGRDGHKISLRSGICGEGGTMLT